MRSVARLSTCRPTVKPICASSPAACTAVVTTSVVLGRPSRGGSGRGGGGGVGRAAAAGFAAARGFGFAADFAAPAFFAAVAFASLAFVPLALFAAVGFAFVAAVGFAFVVALGFVAAAGDVVAPRRSPPMRAGRLERRLPSTLGSGLVAFFGFFLAVFWAMRNKVARARVATGYSDAATRAVTASVRKK
jgi:hypothetical protein